MFQTLKALRERSAALAATRAQLKVILSNALHLSAEDFVQVNEVTCPDPGCLDTVTVVLVMRAGEPTRVIRIEQPLDRITTDDCRRTAEEERDRRARALP